MEASCKGRHLYRLRDRVVDGGRFVSLQINSGLPGLAITVWVAGWFGRDLKFERL